MTPTTRDDDDMPWWLGLSTRLGVLGLVYACGFLGVALGLLTLVVFAPTTPLAILPGLGFIAGGWILGFRLGMNVEARSARALHVDDGPPPELGGAGGQASPTSVPVLSPAREAAREAGGSPRPPPP